MEQECDMASADADRWNTRYSQTTTPDAINPPEIVSAELETVEEGSRVLDLACGFGDAGLALARTGCLVTFVDVSAVVLEAVSRRAEAASLDVRTVVADLEQEPVPSGPWDVIICVHYFDRGVLDSLGEQLAPDGRVVVAIATQTNLERHDRPSARFLLEHDELPTLLPNLRVIRHDEDWRSNGVHEAWLVASPY